MAFYTGQRYLRLSDNPDLDENGIFLSVFFDMQVKKRQRKLLNMQTSVAITTLPSDNDTLKGDAWVTADRSLQKDT